MIRRMYKQPKVYLVLIFPDSNESRWASERPRVGSEIKSRLGNSWRVEEVLQSGTDVYTVHCGPPLALPSPRDLAADLLERARKSVSPLERRRRRWIP
jgi:hypothetical protein